MNYIFFPKTFIKKKENESILEYRERFLDDLNTKDVKIVPVEYDAERMQRFGKMVLTMQQCTDFVRSESSWCDYCDFREFCKEGEKFMLLPKNERTDRVRAGMMDKWIYGDSYSGKTSFMDEFDNVLFVNTDGNIDQITSAVFRIKDEIIVDGRLTSRKYAWELFLELVDELEKNRNHGFERIVLDLVEDLFESCRVKKFKELKIEHESDAGYGKGWDMVRSEFLNTIKRLKNIGLEVTYLSKLLKSTVTTKAGASITTYKPNVTDKIANVLSGTVGATFMLVAEDGKRYLSFKNDPYVFGGSRYNFGVTEIPLNKDEYLLELEKALNNKSGTVVPRKRVAVEKATTGDDANIGLTNPSNEKFPVDCADVPNATKSEEIEETKEVEKTENPQTVGTATTISRRKRVEINQ